MWQPTLPGCRLPPCFPAGCQPTSSALPCQAFPLYLVPPVALMPLAAVWAAIMSTSNARVCRNELLQHPTAAWHLHACYRLLEPLVAPLEPLLLAAGIGHGRRERHCHCGGCRGAGWWQPACSQLLSLVLLVPAPPALSTLAKQPSGS